MSYYDDASLVVIPSGYKTSKVYAEKPTDGSGDLTFTRTGDTATRVNSGLIEKVRTNLNTFSEQWDNAAYTSFRHNITANAGVAPNGTTTADKLIATNVSGSHITFNSVNINSNGEYSISCYVKASGLNKVAIRESKTIGYYASFDLSNGTLLDSSAGQSNTITSVGNGWYRISSTRSYVGVISLGIVTLPNSYTTGDPMTSWVGDNVNGVLVWGGQTEFGTVTDYIPTTTAAVSVGPVANVPRLDYLGSTCPRLNLEPQRSNLITFSEQLDNAAWTKNQSTITANTVVSPDGYTNADALVGNGANSIHTAFQQRTATGSSIHSISVYLKQGTERYAYLLALGRSPTVDNGDVAWFDLQLGTRPAAMGSGLSATITSVGNGWYRVTMPTSAYASSTQIELRVGIATVPGAQINTATGFIYVWGAQLEQGTSETSYIPTLAASATRSVDDATKTGITSLIGQTEGTLFLDFEGGANDSVNHFLGLSDGTTGNRIVIVRSSSNTLYAQIRVGGVEQAFIQTATLTANTRYKCAIAYKLNDIAFYVNGVLVGTDTSATIPATSVFATNTGVSSSFFERAINQTLVFKTRLTNSELATLTTI